VPANSVILLPNWQISLDEFAHLADDPGVSTITQSDLAVRLRQAREAVGLTQVQVADHLGLSRNAIVQIEGAERQVSSIELHRLGMLYGRDLLDFFAEAFVPQGALAAMFREQVTKDLKPAMLETAGRFLEAGRRLDQLEGILSTERVAPAGLRGAPLPLPRGVMDAVRQGEAAAERERTRLGLGLQPVTNLEDLLEEQGVRTLVTELPDGVDGITLCAPQSSPFVVVASGAPANRRQFSLAHEYGHVLMDWNQSGWISRRENQKDLREVRANAFASALLLPAAGVEAFMAGLGKPRRRNTPVILEEDLVRTVRNTEPGFVSEVQVFDVVRVAAHFRVSREAALFRLANLEFVKPGEREGLQEGVRNHGGRLAELMGVGEADQPEEPARASRSRLIGLLLEALRREEVSRGWAVDVARLVGIADDDFEAAVDEAGLRPPPEGVVMPGGL
jgi:Zn-dependent peptidase ImmA (M78 family)/DNA-binding XRE family transcriptional regulator